MKLRELYETNANDEREINGVDLYCEDDNTTASYTLRDFMNKKVPDEWCSADVDYWYMDRGYLVVKVENKPVVKASKRFTKKPNVTAAKYK